MKRENRKLLNKILAVVITASLVFSLTPAMAVAEFSANSQSSAPSSLEVSALDESAVNDVQASDAAAAGVLSEGGTGEAAAGDTNAVDTESAGKDVGAAADADDSDASEEADESEDPLPSDLTKFNLVEIDPISRDKMVELLAASPAAAPRSLLADDDAAEPVYPEELDGAKIEQISVEWITKDTVEDGDNSRLSLIPGNNESFSVRMRRISLYFTSYCFA